MTQDEILAGLVDERLAALVEERLAALEARVNERVNEALATLPRVATMDQFTAFRDTMMSSVAQMIGDANSTMRGFDARLNGVEHRTGLRPDTMRIIDNLASALSEATSKLTSPE